MTKSLYRVFHPLRHVILACAIVSAGTPLYLNGLKSLNRYANNHSEVIHSAFMLEDVVASERKKLSIASDVHIDIIYNDRANTSYSTRIGKGFYDIVLSSKHHTRAIIRHELYHIAKGHCDWKANKYIDGLAYFLYEEPAAALYSLRK
jgi:hypothetical protein